jgi:hypothetical protein
MTTTMALAGAAHGAARWPVIALEIALAVAVGAAGVLADRRARQRRRATGGPRVQTVMRAISHSAPRNPVDRQDTRTWPAPTTLIRSYAGADGAVPGYTTTVAPGRVSLISAGQLAAQIPPSTGMTAPVR